MVITARFNFTDWKGDTHTGEVFRSHNGEFIPDSILGMGKNYSEPRKAVNDYLRRMGGELVNYIDNEQADQPLNVDGDPASTCTQCATHNRYNCGACC